MISLKDYAKQHHVSYEAIRTQVKRYQEQLGEHIIQDGRTQYLDDVAVAFLNERRQKNPVVVYQQSKDEAIEELKTEVTRLLLKQEVLRDRIDELTEYRALAEERRLSLEARQEAQERRERELQAREGEFAQELAEARQEAAAAAQKAAEEKAAADLARAEQRHQGELTAAQQRERELREYMAADEAWRALGWLKRRKTQKPAPPAWLKRVDT